MQFSGRNLKGGKFNGAMIEAGKFIWGPFHASSSSACHDCFDHSGDGSSDRADRFRADHDTHDAAHDTHDGAHDNTCACTG
jgi:hypothetical protein